MTTIQIRSKRFKQINYWVRLQRLGTSWRDNGEEVRW